MNMKFMVVNSSSDKVFGSKSRRLFVHDRERLMVSFVRLILMSAFAFITFVVEICKNSVMLCSNHTTTAFTNDDDDVDIINA